MRHYTRYKANLPISVTFIRSRGSLAERLKDVSVSGLCVTLSKDPGIGSQLLISIPYLTPPFQTEVEVVWSIAEPGHYNVGLRLLNQDDLFSVRMVEQVCHIEHYRRQLLEKEGRQLTAEQAAREWIDKYSAAFPELEYGHAGVRRYIRHPVDIPIETRLIADNKVFVKKLRDVSLGGLRLKLPVRAEAGTAVRVSIRDVVPVFETDGRVAWCKKAGKGYEMGIELSCAGERNWTRVVEQLSIARDGEMRR